MRLAVTGARGFIGRHVLAELAGRGVQARLLQRPEFDLLDGSEDLYERAGRPEVLLHLAWGGLPNYQSLRHFEVERPAQYAFLRALVCGGLRHLVVAGTCFEYGMQSGPLHEDLPCTPANAYGYAKDTLRRELEFLKRETPFRLTWARLFYLWGDGQATGSLWPQLQAAVQRGDRHFPMSGGEQLRDYLPVAQAASWLVDLALQPHGEGIVNLCAGRPVSVRALVEGWIAQHGWAITPQLGRYPYPSHEPMAFWGDNRRLLQRLAGP